MLKKIVLKTSYDPYLTFYPSFIYPLFKHRVYGRNYTIVKAIGEHKGLAIRIEDNIVYIDRDVDERFLLDITGLWFDPLAYVNDVKDAYSDFVLKLIEKYRCIRIAISPYDRVWIFISIFLSRATSFHRNTVKWIKELHDKCLYNNPLYCDPLVVGRNFQLRQLHELLEHSLNALEDLLQPSPVDDEDMAWFLRREFLRLKYVGVKTIDAYLLFTTHNSFFTPVDRHYIVFTRKFFKLELYPPHRNCCIRYSCHECPYRNRCLCGWSIGVFGRLSGWIQTLSYLYGNRVIVIDNR